MTDSRCARTTGLLLCLLLLATLVLYRGGLHGPYVMDDLPNLVHNPHLIIHGLSWSALKAAALSSDAGPLHRPVAMLSFALNYSIAGNMDPFPAKLVNVLLHLTVGFCIFLLSRRLLPYLWIFGGRVPDSGEVDGMALMGTAVWLLHPLFVSTVLYTVQRMEILSALFTVLGCLFYLEFRGRQIERGDRGFVLIAGIIVFTLLATLSKENGALLPGFLLLLEYFTFKFKKPTAVSSFNHRLLLVVLVIPALFIPCYLAVRFSLHWNLRAFVNPFTVYQRFITEFRVLPQYAAWLLFAGGAPMGLYHDDFRVSRSLLQPPATLFCVLVIVAVTATAILLARRRHIVSFGVLWFLWGQILESTTLPLVPMFEHRNYLPGYGLLLCLGAAAWQGSALLTRRRALHITVLFLLLAVPAWQLRDRVSHWADESDFLVHQLKAHPRSPEVMLYAAEFLGDRGRFAEAVKALRRAQRLAPAEVIYPLAELTLRCKYEPDRPAPARLAERLQRDIGSAIWSSTARLNYASMVQTCIPTSAKDELLFGIYRQAQSRGRADLGFYSLLGEANVDMHRHDYQAALGAWGKAVNRYPYGKRLQPELKKLRSVLERAGKIPGPVKTRRQDRSDLSRPPNQ